MPKIEIISSDEVFVNSSCTIIIKSGIVNIKYELKDGNYSILIFNDFNNDVDFNDYGIINNSSVKIDYIQLDKYDLKQNTKIDVNKDSKLSINTTYLAVNNKQIKFDLYNKQSDSSVDIYNNIVCLNDSDFSLDCIGTIVKNAKRSKCHQKSNCLTMQKPKKAKVLPVLNIDENDVEASHSLSSGTIDEEVLFYMNSRGLDFNHSLDLILQSYLIRDDDYYSNYEYGSYIKEKTIEKVNDICKI